VAPVTAAVRFALPAVVAGLLVAACSTGPDASAAAPPVTHRSGGAPATDKACSGGLSGQEPGVVSITCDGSATIHISVGEVSQDLHGGQCHSAGGVWSASAGVIIDATGLHGKYAGPPVNNVVVNDTSTPGRGTIQSSLGGKLYFDLGNAAMTVAPDRRSAHLTGTSERASDAPGAKISVTVTC
jgi:hypothetical protein